MASFVGFLLALKERSLLRQHYRPNQVNFISFLQGVSSQLLRYPHHPKAFFHYAFRDLRSLDDLKNKNRGETVRLDTFRSEQQFE